MFKKIDYIKNLYKFEDLEKNGVKSGDIIAYLYNEKENGFCWNYVLLRDTFPNNFDTALCCFKMPEKPNKMTIYQVGFHWCGSTDCLKFRIIGEEEKQEFIETCISRLKMKINKNMLWDIDIYSQIFAALIKYKLISEDKITNLNEELKIIHGVDLIKYYKKHYGC